MKSLLLVVFTALTSWISASTNFNKNVFNIQIVYTTPLNASIQQDITNAANRWKQLITKGFGSTLTLTNGTSVCSQPPLANDLVVRDLLIFVSVQPLDGPGENLVRAGPCGYDTQGNVRLGQFQIDSADIGTLASNGKFPTVAIHEIGHVLGVGTNWDRKKLLLDATAQNEILYEGANAAPRNGEVGASGIPNVQNTGGPGIARVHWAKSEYGNELMTPYVTGTTQPLSVLTAASLIDLG